jgi:hypothetical protein
LKLLNIIVDNVPKFTTKIVMDKDKDTDIDTQELSVKRRCYHVSSSSSSKIESSQFITMDSSLTGALVIDDDHHCEKHNNKEKIVILLFNHIASTSVWKDKIIEQYLSTSEFLALKLLSRYWNQNFMIPFSMYRHSLPRLFNIEDTRQWATINDKSLLLSCEYWSKTSLPSVESILHWIFPRRIMSILDVFRRFSTLSEDALTHYITRMMQDANFCRMLIQIPFLLESFLQTLFHCGHEKLINHVIDVYTSINAPCANDKPPLQSESDSCPVNQSSNIQGNDPFEFKEQQEQAQEQKPDHINNENTDPPPYPPPFIQSSFVQETTTTTTIALTTHNVPCKMSISQISWEDILFTRFDGDIDTQHHWDRLPRHVSNSMLLWYWQKIQDQKWSLTTNETISKALIMMCILNGTSVGFKLAQDVVPQVYIEPRNRGIFYHVALFKKHQRQKQQQQQHSPTPHTGYDPMIGISIVHLYFPPYRHGQIDNRSQLSDYESITAFVVHHQTDKLSLPLLAQSDHWLAELMDEAIKSNNLRFFKQHRDVLLSQPQAYSKIVHWFVQAWKSHHLEMCREILSRIPSRYISDHWTSVTQLQPLDITQQDHIMNDPGVRCLVLLYEMHLWNSCQIIQINIDFKIDSERYIFPWPMMKGIEFMQQQQLPCPMMQTFEFMKPQIITNGWSILPDCVTTVLLRDAYLHHRFDLMDFAGISGEELRDLGKRFSSHTDIASSLFLKLRAYQWLYECPLLNEQMSMSQIAHHVVCCNDIPGLEWILKRYEDNIPLRREILHYIHEKSHPLLMKWIEQHSIFSSHFLLISSRPRPRPKPKTKSKSKNLK